MCANCSLEGNFRKVPFTFVRTGTGNVGVTLPVCDFCREEKDLKAGTGKIANDAVFVISGVHPRFAAALVEKTIDHLHDGTTRPVWRIV
jgi:hypothetical protein